MISIGSNNASLNAQRRLGETTTQQSAVFERLSSGLRITRARDDAAGLAISSSLNADTKIYSQAVKNINDGISVLNIAEGAFQQLTNVVIRQKELAEQAANGVYNSSQRLALHKEANALVKEYNRILRSTTVNGISVIDGTGDTVTIQQGVGAVNSLAVAVGQGGIAAGDGTFQLAQTFLNSAAARMPSLADFNGDGVLDAAFGAYSGNLSIALNAGNGTFSAPTLLGYVSAGTSSLVSGDINNDGKADLIVSDFANSEVVTLLGNGNGTFRAPSTITGLSQPRDAVVSDLNSDGALDLIVTEWGTNRVGVHLGNSDGSFKAALYNSVFAPINLAINDLNGDGIMDIVSTRNDYTAVLIGNGNGTFRAAVSYADDGGSMVRIADFDGDGDNDFVTTSVGVAVFLNNGDGTFQNHRIYDWIGVYGGGGIQMEIADVNGDGNIDVVGSRTADSNIQVFINNGNGSFLAARTSPIGGGGGNVGIALGDINGDGIVDLVTPDQNNAFTDVRFGVVDSTGRQNHFAYSLNLLTAQGAREALARTTTILRRTNSIQGNLGAFRSRLDSSVNNLRTLTSGTNEAYSRITDADIAEESAQLIKTRILKEATVAVLAQANQQPALALSLLR